MKKQLLLLVIFVSVIASNVKAQDYDKAIGLRGGFPTALSGKFFMNNNTAIEGLLSGYRGGFEITGLYEIHANAFDVPYLNWYYGGGAHIGFFDDGIARPGYYYGGRGAGFNLGIDGIFGLEYTLTDIPFVLGVDLKPTLDFAPTPFFWFGGGVSVRFYF